MVPAVATKPHAALPAIRKALVRCAPAKDGWYHLGEFGNAAKLEAITPKSHGASGVKALLKATKQFTFNEPHHFRPVELRAVSGGQ
jgi:hypothetical protein